MNVLLMSLLYPKDMYEEAAKNADGKLQNQINNYQWAFVEGLQQNLLAGEQLSVVNALPVGVYPLHYRKAYIPCGARDNGAVYELGCINLPYLKQHGRAKRAEKALRQWVELSPNNRTVLLYTLYLPFMQAIAKVKKAYPDLKACVIVTDLPNEMGLASGRKGLLKRIEYARGRRSLSLCRAFDGFVLLTAPMAEPLMVGKKPSIVMEGLVLTHASAQSVEGAHPDGKRSVLYTGTLEPDLGIADLLTAFKQLPEYELWICGGGSMESQVKAVAESAQNIRFFGYVPQQQSLALQQHATLLINPRTPQGLFTRYSFPSKTLEYMRSGKPVLCYKLEGIPKDYDQYLCYIAQVGAQGIADAVTQMMQKSDDELHAMGKNARDYVLLSKNPRVQCKRLVDLLRSL